MIDVPRTCLHDTWLSRIAAGRLVATVAELAFAAQWALLLREAASALGSIPAQRAARSILPIIVAAELFSWTAVLTINNLLHAIENSLWTLAAALAIASAASMLAGADARTRRFLHAVIATGAGYVAFMVSVDVPMYLARWHADLAAGRLHLSLAEGMRQLLARCVVVHDWAAWREDVPWLSLYFSVAVWISIALPHALPFRRRAVRGEGNLVKDL